MTRSKQKFIRIGDNFFLALIILLISTCSPVPTPAPQATDVDPLRFAQVVKGYQSADSSSKPASGALLFVGSSSIHGWKTLADDFSEFTVINRGMGGSHMSDLIYYMNDIVYPYNPAAILVYEGDNDIASGKSPERVLTDYKTFVEGVHGKWPDLSIFFISIKPSLARIGHLHSMAQANALIKSYIDGHKSLYYIDVFTPMLGEDGNPKPEIFGHDGLHMNHDGYELWASEIKRVLALGGF